MFQNQTFINILGRKSEKPFEMHQNLLPLNIFFAILGRILFAKIIVLEKNNL